MIRKDIKKNVYFAIVCFVFTLIPLGAYNTDYGLTTFFTSVLLLLSLAFAAKVLVDYNNSPSVHNLINKHRDKVSCLLFLSNESKFRIVVLVVPIAISFLIGFLLYGNTPLLADSIVQYDHAKLLLMGKFSVPIHPFPEFFPLYAVTDTGERWYTQYQLGHLLMLALGHLLGIIGLINPIMYGISALLLYLIAYDNYGVRIARITGILTIFCIQWWYIASEYLNHNTSLLGCMLFFWAWLRFLKTFELKYSLISGLGIGLAIITRPISTIFVALPFSIYGLYKIWREPAKRWFNIIPAALIFSLLVAWQLYFNLQTTGNFFVFGPEEIYGKQVSYGFGNLLTTTAFGDFYKNTTHDIWRGLAHFSNSFVNLNHFLFWWPFPSLFFACLGWMVFKTSIISKLMFASFLSLETGYIPYFFQDFSFGVRFAYEATGFLIIATAFGLIKMPAILRVIGVKMRRSKIVGLTGFYMCILLTIGSIFFVVSQLPRAIMYYSQPSAFELDAQFPDNSLVFADEKRYKQFTIFMPPLDSNRVIYAKNRGVNNQKLIDYYPNRTVFVESEGVFKKVDK